jgi:hypothetical protein
MAVTTIKDLLNFRSRLDMNKVQAISDNLNYLMRLLISIALLSSAVAWAAKTERMKTELGNDEETFLLTGTCQNGEPYRLFSYQKRTGGLSQSFYDYEGPAGKGSVRSDTYPKVMAVRVCRKLAEIINANYWE